VKNNDLLFGFLISMSASMIALVIMFMAVEYVEAQVGAGVYHWIEEKGVKEYIIPLGISLGIGLLRIATMSLPPRIVR